MKNTLKFLSLLTLTALAVAPLARAEDAPPASASAPAVEHARPERGNRFKQLAEKLQLTDVQKTQIKPIMEKAAQDGMALRDDDSLSKHDKRAKMMAIRKTSQDQIRALLTADQQKTFDAMPPERGHRGPPKGDDAPPPPKE